MSSQSAKLLPNNRLNTLLDQLYGLHPKLIDLSLDRVERFLNELGNPHLKLPPVIHVAGTNGKGSTIAALRAILEAHGKTCHVATSPHLLRINERIVVAGEEIDDGTLADLIEECLAKNKGQNITFFEMIMCITFLTFSRTPADFCLLETGMGGRLDATNVVPEPIATIITTISKDHQDFLGSTLSKIAAEKAGIIKADTPCILGKQTEEAIEAGVIDTICSKALSTNAALHQFGSDWSVEPMQDRFYYQDGKVRYDLPYPALIGSHQIYNTGSAIAACRVIPNFELDAEKLSTAMGQMHWPGRLQKLDHKGFDGITGTDWQIWLDGGHNDSAGRVLAQQIDRWTTDDDTKKVHIIMGMMTRKNPLEFIELFVSKITSITCIPVDSEENSYTPSELSEIIEPTSNAPVLMSETVQEAIDGILNQFPQPSIILITGSLYLAGQVLSEHNVP
ncbi:MAG: folylpolyglutamate synthase/dihydrofolate synthase family protein [Pseudomonadota bacterium]